MPPDVVTRGRLDPYRLAARGLGFFRLQKSSLVLALVPIGVRLSFLVYLLNFAAYIAFIYASAFVMFSSLPPELFRGGDGSRDHGSVGR